VIQDPVPGFLGLLLLVVACGSGGGAVVDAAGPPADAAGEDATDAATDAAPPAELLACAPGGARGLDDVGAGTRLRPRFHVAPGGARTFDAFHDLVLDLDCSFEQTEGGGWRCVPMAMMAFDYEDAACTRPLSSGAPYVHHRPFGACTNWIAGVFRTTGGPIEQELAVFRPTGNHGCVPGGTRSGLYRTVEVPLAMFEAGAPCVDPTAARIHGTRMVGDDGSSAPFGLHDSGRDEP
jgi:hypothetical protein